MGKVLQLIGGLAISAWLFGKAAGKASSQVTWQILPFSLRDVSIRFIDGKLVAVLKSRINILNETPVSIYLEGYSATISQEGERLAELDTTTRIELPSGEPRQLSAEFVVRAEDAVSRIENLLNGGHALAPIIIDGALELSDGLILPISRKLEFFTVT